MNLAPIALFVYNRPWHTQQTVESLRKNILSEQSELFIFSDGPKDGSTVKNVEDVRDYLKTVKGFKKVDIIEREANLGLAKSVISGVSDLIKKYGQIIVLEDDLYLSPDFLSYMNKALDHYAKNEKVMQVSGHMFPVQLKASTCGVFLPFITTWGWGTWGRSWQYFDPSAKDYELLRTDRKLRRRFNIDGAYPYFKMLENQMNGKIDSWGIRWHLSVFMKGGLTLYPLSTLVQNLGFDGSGTHFREVGKREEIHEFVPLAVGRFPDAQIDQICYDKIRKYLISQNSFFNRMTRMISRHLKGIRMASS